MCSPACAILQPPGRLPVAVWWYVAVGISIVVGSATLQLWSPEHATAAATFARAMGVAGILAATKSFFDLLKLRGDVLKARLELPKATDRINAKRISHYSSRSDT